MHPEQSEFIHSPEAKVPKPSIRLEFFRHDAKSKPSTAGPRIGDDLVRLTAEGRSHSTEIGKTKNPRPEVALAYGSRRERAIETSLRQMLANDERITSETTLEEIRDIIGQSQKPGRKEKMVAQLDFNNDGTPEYNQEIYRHYLETKDALHFLVHDSDDLVLRLNDTKSTSYSRTAGNQAEIIAHYLKILPVWKRINEDEESGAKYKAVSAEMQRFLAGHGASIESLLLKIIEKTRGRAAVDEFIDSLPNKNELGLSEGYSIILTYTQENKPTILVKFQDRQWEVDGEVINEIIKERDTLNATVRGAVEAGEERKGE